MPDLSPECSSGFASGHRKCREGWCECRCHDTRLAAAFAAVTTPANESAAGGSTPAALLARPSEKGMTLDGRHPTSPPRHPAAARTFPRDEPLRAGRLLGHRGHAARREGPDGARGGRVRRGPGCVPREVLHWHLLSLRQRLPVRVRQLRLPPVAVVVITIGQRPEPDAPVLTEAEWHLYLTADAKTAPQILQGCAAWLTAQKARVTA